MRTHRVQRIIATLILVTAVATSVMTASWPLRVASAATITLPDLRINVPTGDFSIGTNPSTGHRQLQFTHQTWDAGTGPFAIKPTYNSHTGVSTFVQDIYRSPSPGVWIVDHTAPIAVTGVFQGPSDYHFPLTRFTLDKLGVAGPSGVVAVSPKVDYCITGDTYIGGVPNTPASTSPPQSDCADPNALLGFSVGWGDQYDQTDNGQPIDLTGVPDGTYVLQATVDPQHIFQESTTSNDVTNTTIKISGSNVSVLSQSSPVTPLPSIGLTSPANGATLHGVVVLQATAHATTPATVASVRYLLDGAPLGPALTNAPYTYAWATNLASGSHTLSAQVTDSNGTVATSNIRTITIARSTKSGLAVDVSAVATGHGTVATRAFSTAVAGDTVIALVAADGPLNSAQKVTVTGMNLTWHLVRRSNGQAGDAEIWRATAPRVMNHVTVASKELFTGYAQQLEVLAFSGAAGVGSSQSSNAPNGPSSATITTLGTGSDVLGVGSDWDNATARAVNPGQSMIQQWIDQGDGDTFWVQGTNTTTKGPGQKIVVGDSAPTLDRWDMAIVEVRAAARPKLVSAILSPAPNESVFGMIPLTVAVNDVVPLRNVTYRIGSSIVGQSLVPTHEISLEWNTRATPNGPATLVAVVTDVLGRTVSARVPIVVANPTPTMTCFVLDAQRSASGGKTVALPTFHVASPNERLVAFVRTSADSATKVTLSSPGITWALLREITDSRGTVSVWTATSPPQPRVIRVFSRLARGSQDLTVIAIESTDGIGAVDASSGHAITLATLATRHDVSLIFSTGVVSGSRLHQPAGWTFLSQVSHRSHGTTSWVGYTTQPILLSGTRVKLPPQFTSPSGWSRVTVELPGAGD